MSHTSAPISTINPESTCRRCQWKEPLSITSKSKRLSTFPDKSRSLITTPSSTRLLTCPRPFLKRRLSMCLWRLSPKGLSTTQSKSKQIVNGRQVVHYPEETVDVGRRRAVGGVVGHGLARTSSMGSIPPRPSSHYAGIASTIPSTTVTVNAPGQIVTTTVNQTYYAQPPSANYIQPQSSAATLTYVNSSANNLPTSPYSNNYTYTVSNPSDLERKISNGNATYGSTMQQKFNINDYQMRGDLSNGIRMTQTQYPI